MPQFLVQPNLAHVRAHVAMDYWFPAPQLMPVHLYIVGSLQCSASVVPQTWFWRDIREFHDLKQRYEAKRMGIWNDIWLKLAKAVTWSSTNPLFSPSTRKVKLFSESIVANHTSDWTHCHRARGRHLEIHIAVQRDLAQLPLVHRAQSTIERWSQASEPVTSLDWSHEDVSNRG